MRAFQLLTALISFSASSALAQQLVSGPIVVLLGAPGSGKTTQAAAVAKFLGVPVLAVSDLIRDNAGELRKVRRSGITGIEPETDPLLNKFFEARLQRGDLAKGMVLDGYPNTKDHADFASKLVESGRITRPVILHLRIPDETVRKRLEGRPSGSVEQRLKDYHRETTALQIYFPNAEVIEIDGTKKPGAVTKEIEKALKAKFQK